MVAILRNPTSGRGRSSPAWETFQGLLKSAGVPYREVLTEGADTVRAQAAELAREHEAVLAGGGDGTLSEVANGIYGTGAILGVVPLGTGNDFSRMLGIGTSMEKAADAVKRNQPFACDAIRLTLADGTSRLALNVCGTGFDAAVAARINRGIRGLTGTGAYLAAILLELATHRPAKLRLTADSLNAHPGENLPPEEWEELAMLACAANAESYGGGMRVAPRASLEDGLMDLVVVGAVGKARFLRQFPKVFSGKHTDLPEVSYCQTSRLRIDSPRPMPVLADGEIVGQTPVQFEVVPGAFQVLR